MLFFAVFSASEGYRVNSLSRGKVEARGRSKAKVNFHRVRATEGTSSNSSIFIAAALMATFAGTIIGSAAAPGVITAAAGATALVANCAPSLGLVAPVLLSSGSLVPPALAVAVPLALIAALVLVGGLVALHVSTTAALAALAFCPVSNFQQEPMQAIITSQPYLAFPDDLGSLMEDGLDGGMPECHDLSAVVLQQTNCGVDDHACMEHACREKCCEDEHCTFYQFSLDEIDSGNTGEGELVPVTCQLGEKHQLVDKNCEKPFFGEMCVSRLPLWPQEGADHTKCLSGYGAGEGFMVDDQMDCQETAVTNGHCFYQYNEQKKTCATCTDLSDVTIQTLDNWKVYQDPDCGAASHVKAGAVCTDWELKKVLLSKLKETTEVRPTSRGCRGNSAPCLKKRCRQECAAQTDCTFYQFQEGENKCFLGTSETLEPSQVDEAWFGGFVSSERKCKTGYQCPGNNQCVDDCSDCAGYSQNGPESKGRGKNKRKWCMRNAVESLCYEDNWNSEYRGVPLDEWCRGMEKVTVEINETLDFRETGEGICRKACCSDPDCAAYQMHQEDAKTIGSELQAGSSIECWLGMETAGGKPKFKCTGRKMKRWRQKPAPVGASLSQRGCTDGSSACLTKKMCVDHCRTECLGAPREAQGHCEPVSTYEEEHLDSSSDARHKHAFKDNIQHAMPKLHSKKEGSYYMQAERTQEAMYAEKDNLIIAQLNSQNLANGKLKDMAEACQTLKDDDDDDLLCWFEETDDGSGACKCEFNEKADCGAWFHDSEHMKQVVEDVGMLIFGGDKCTCSQEKTDGVYHCEFGLLGAIPKMRADRADEGSFEISGTKKPHCPPKQCQSNTNKAFDNCEVVTFGDHNCGYSCTSDAEEYYCDQKCNCHRELTPEEIEDEKELADDQCSADRVCPNMRKCVVLDYGSYGCGYSCDDVDGTLHFCSQDCECETE